MYGFKGYLLASFMWNAPPPVFMCVPTEPYTISYGSKEELNTVCGNTDPTIQVTGCVDFATNHILMLDGLDWGAHTAVLAHEFAHINGWDSTHDNQNWLYYESTCKSEFLD